MRISYATNQVIVTQLPKSGNLSQFLLASNLGKTQTNEFLTMVNTSETQSNWFPIQIYAIKSVRFGLTLVRRKTKSS